MSYSCRTICDGCGKEKTDGDGWTKLVVAVKYSNQWLSPTLKGIKNDSVYDDIMHLDFCSRECRSKFFAVGGEFDRKK